MSVSTQRFDMAVMIACNVPGLESKLCSKFQLSSSAHPGKLQMLPQVFESLQPMLNRMESQFPIISLAQPWLLEESMKMHQQVEANFSLFQNKIINF